MSDRERELIERARRGAPTGERLKGFERRKFDWLCGEIQRALQERFPDQHLPDLPSKVRAGLTVVMRGDWYALWREGVLQTQRHSPRDLCYGFPLRAGVRSQAEVFQIIPTEGARS